jgi:hypothetical protein
MIDKRKIQFLWETNRWDGPLSGIAIYHGDLCFWQCTNPDKSLEERVFELFHIPKDLIEDVYCKWNIFKITCGSHCDLWANGERKDCSDVRRSAQVQLSEYLSELSKLPDPFQDPRITQLSCGYFRW